MNLWKSLKPVSIYQWTGYLLLILALVGGWKVGYQTVWLQMGLSLLLCVGVDAIIWWRKTKRFRFSWTGLIAAVIIASVLPPSAVWWQVLLISALAMGSKYLIRYQYQNIFNPAAFGLVAGLLLFHTQLGWWGEGYPVVTILLGSFALTRVRRHWTVVWSFMGVTLLLIILRSFIFDVSFYNQAYVLFGTSFFFTFFMLTEPKTSPIKPLGLLAFSGTVAVVSFFTFLWWSAGTFLLGLLVANLLTPVLKRFQRA